MSMIAMPDAIPGRERPDPRAAMAGASLPLAGLVLVLVMSAGSGRAGSCGGVSPDQYVMLLPAAPVGAG